MLGVGDTEASKPQNNLCLHTGYYLSRDEKTGYDGREGCRMLMEQRARALTKCGTRESLLKNEYLT